MNGQGLAAAKAAFKKKRYEDTLIILNGLLDKTPTAAPIALLGETFEKMGLRSEAAEAFEQVFKFGGKDGALYARRAARLFFDTGDRDRSQLLALKLLNVLPNDPDVAFILATQFRAAGETVLLDLVKNTLVKSDNPEHLKLAGELIGDEDRNPATLTLFRKLAALHPDDPYTQFKYMSVAREYCDYTAIERLERVVDFNIGRGNVAVLEGETGYSNLLHCADERLNRLAVNNHTRPTPPSPEASRQRRNRPHIWGDKIRIGYLSSDLWDDHATMRLFQSVLEAHDAKRFDVTLYCHTPLRSIDFDSGNRQKWGRIVPVLDKTDTEAADIIRADATDILVDLKGHTGGSRAAILNALPAPIQVAWLGFPGSTVNIDCDYVIGDPVVLPDSSKPHYHEKFCRMPETYQPNDPVYRPLPPAKSRAELGLPEDRFVFAAFNTPRKITLAVLDCWADILRRSPASVLWVMIDGDIARANFLAAMKKRSISTRQIIFAAKRKYDDHIARLQAADLGLDTFPYNGHTTTSDKLWAGLPVLTAKGSNFASRVSESLLTALGLPELVAPDHRAYADRAVALSNDAGEVARLKEKIAANRYIAPLFDAERFCDHLETAYTMMAERAKAGLEPDHFDVPALAPRTAPFR